MKILSALFLTTVIFSDLETVFSQKTKPFFGRVPEEKVTLHKRVIYRSKPKAKKKTAEPMPDTYSFDL